MVMQPKQIQPAVKSGQVWQDRDPRSKRKIEIVTVKLDTVIVRNLKTKRETKISLSRFSTEATSAKKGYKLVKDVASSPAPVLSSPPQPATCGEATAHHCDSHSPQQVQQPLTQPQPAPSPNQS